MKVIECLEKTYKEDPCLIRERVVCKDGFSVSIQGGTPSHYCDPRELCNVYNSVELGFPSELDKSLEPYAEEPETCDTVFGYVPIEVVEELISKHGGISNE